MEASPGLFFTMWDGSPACRWDAIGCRIDMQDARLTLARNIIRLWKDVLHREKTETGQATDSAG